MGHRIKGQRPSRYRPSATRRPSGLSPVREVNENFIKTWNKFLKYVSKMRHSPSPRKRSPPKGVQKGRFFVLN